MNRAIQEQFDARAKVLKALAHPTRLFIVEELSKGERCVHDLTDEIGADMSTVSKHLSVLRNHDILADRREGNSVYYRLLTPCVLDFFACTTRVLEKRLIRLD